MEKKMKMPGKRAVGGTFTGEIYVHERFRSKALGNERPIWVYLPPGYHDDQQKRFPVLYMHDGQNLFNSEISFSGVDWGIDETAEWLIKKGMIRPIIIVAVSNTPDRDSEYTPVPDPEYGGGNLDQYAVFLINEVKPFIEKNYRALPGPETTGIMGSSLGGLASLYLGWKYDSVFGIVGALSPSLWWSDRYLTKMIADDEVTTGPNLVWIDIGSKEGIQDHDGDGISDTVENTRDLMAVFLEKGFVFGHDLFYGEALGASHSEWYWSRRSELILMALFGIPRKKSKKHNYQDYS